MLHKQSKIKKWKIPLYKIHYDDDDIRSVSRVIQRGTDWALGPEIETFEKMLSKYVGTKYCLAFNSGTSALHSALLAVGVRQGHNVIVPSFSFIATANSALMVNAKPLFVDIDEDTLGINPSSLKTSISKKTKVILPIHYAGLPCQITKIKQIAQKNKITLIEDAAESLGSKIKNKMIGTFGDIAVFSFASNKVVTTGEGGAITTNSKKIYEKLKLLRSHGRMEVQNYFSTNLQPEYVTLGFNWRMSSITAALASAQLNKIEKLINLRRKKAKYLSERLRKFKQIIVPTEPPSYRHVYQLYSIRLKNSKKRDKLMNFLSSKRIMSKVFFYPIHQSTYYKKIGYGKSQNLELTNIISKEILTLPMYPGLEKENLNYIIDSIKEFAESENLE